MSLLYNLDIDTAEDMLHVLAQNFQKQRLEKGIPRKKGMDIIHAVAECRQEILSTQFSSASNTKKENR